MRPKGEIANIAIMLAAVVGPFIGFLIAVYLAWNRILFVSDLVLFFSFTLVLGMGVTIGYHRMLTHQGFDAPEWLRGLFLILGCMALAGSKPDEWAATHIRHHALSDEEGDPHSPLEGFWHAHFGWLFSLDSFSYAEEYAPQLLKDRTVMFVSKTSTLWMILPFLLPFLLGGWTGLLWGGVVRLFWTTHTVWSVNSICHSFGDRAFETNDESRNEWIIGLLAFGEGWHNNHHAFPRNAFHGMRWWQFDLSGLLITAMEKVGLVWNVQRVSVETEVLQRTRMQVMRGAMTDLRANVLSSLSSARNELKSFAVRFSREPISHEQLQTCIEAHEERMKRLDAMMLKVSASAHMKRQKLLSYQKEAQTLLDDYKRTWSVQTGVAVSA